MSVLKGEGRVPILFGSTSISVGPLTHSGYLARPDLSGEWPTIVAVADVWGVTSSLKDVCRRLARHGFAVLAPDVYRGQAPARRVDYDAAAAAYRSLEARRVRSVLADTARFIANPAGFWSSGEDGFGWLGVGAGGGPAVDALAAGAGDAVALVAAPPQSVIDAGPVPAVPLLGLYGRADETAPLDDLPALRDVAPHGEFVLYEGAGTGFFDDSADEYDGVVAGDVLDRLIEFFGKHLPAAPG